MSLQEWKHNEINQKLMKKWGLLKEEKNEPKDVKHADDVLAGEEAGEDAAEDLEEASLTEDSGEEESEHYGKDESADKREEDNLEHHLDAIEHHLKALRSDMHFDQDHIDEGHEHSADCGCPGALSEGDDDTKESPSHDPDLRRRTKGGWESEVPKPGVRVTDPEHLSRTTAKLPPVKVKEGMSRKISVREAKELTSRIIERIKAESK